MSTFIPSKTITQMAGEFKLTPRTLTNHIKKNETLKTKFESGLQLPKFQKLLYETFGYPPGVNKQDYENV